MPIYRVPRRGKQQSDRLGRLKWHIRIKVPGFDSGNKVFYGTAAEAAQQEREEFRKHKIEDNLSHLVSSYLKSIEHRALSLSHRDIIKNDLGRLIEWGGVGSPQQLARQSVRRWVKWLRETKTTRFKTPYRVKSIKRHVSSVSGFCEFLIDEGLIDSNPARGMRLNIREAPKESRFISPPEFCSLWQAAADDDERALLFTLAGTGMRSSEIATLAPRHLETRQVGETEARYVVRPASERKRFAGSLRLPMSETIWQIRRPPGRSPGLRE